MWFVIYSNVGAPRQIYQNPYSGVIGVPIGDNYTLEIGIFGNPSPIVSDDNWTFTDYNGTRYEVLPDNVNTSVHPGTERLTIVATLTLNNTQNRNYGNYTLETGTDLGDMSPVLLTVVPIGKWIICSVTYSLNTHF